MSAYSISRLGSNTGSLFTGTVRAFVGGGLLGFAASAPLASAASGLGVGLLKLLHSPSVTHAGFEIGKATLGGGVFGAALGFSLLEVRTFLSAAAESENDLIFNDFRNMHGEFGKKPILNGLEAGAVLSILGAVGVPLGGACIKGFDGPVNLDVMWASVATCITLGVFLGVLASVPGLIKATSAQAEQSAV